MIRVLHEEHALSDRLISHMLKRKARIIRSAFSFVETCLHLRRAGRFASFFVARNNAPS